MGREKTLCRRTDTARGFFHKFPEGGRKLRKTNRSQTLDCPSSLVALTSASGENQGRDAGTVENDGKARDRRVRRKRERKEGPMPCCIIAWAQ